MANTMPDDLLEIYWKIKREQKQQRLITAQTELLEAQTALLRQARRANSPPYRPPSEAAQRAAKERLFQRVKKRQHLTAKYGRPNFSTVIERVRTGEITRQEAIALWDEYGMGDYMRKRLREARLTGTKPRVSPSESVRSPYSEQRHQYQPTTQPKRRATVSKQRGSIHERADQAVQAREETRKWKKYQDELDMWVTFVRTGAIGADTALKRYAINHPSKPVYPLRRRLKEAGLLHKQTNSRLSKVVEVLELVKSGKMTSEEAIAYCRTLYNKPKKHTGLSNGRMLTVGQTAADITLP